MANTSVKFRDSQNWTQVNGLVIDQSSLSEYYKDERVQPAYVVPEIVTDVWNGKKHDVQHIRHNGWRFEFYGKESELQKLSSMQSCDIIYIEDIDNGLNHTVDMQVSEWLSFSEPERIADTSNWRFVIEYRTDKTIINKYVPRSNQVTLIGSSTYYSKYEKLSYNGELEEIRVQWGEGGEELLQETNNVGFRVLLYLNDTDKNNFKNDWNQNRFTIDGASIIRKLPLEITELAENLHQVIVSCITVRQTIDSTAALDNVVAINIGSVFYSKFEKLHIPDIVEDVPIDWPDGTQRVLRNTVKKGYEVLMYLNESNYNSFQNLWDDTQASDILIDSVAVVEKLPLEPTKLASGYYQIIVNYISDVDVTTNDLTPLNTHTLVVSDSGSYTFYTDYAVQNNVNDTDKDPFTNDDGLPVDSKTISNEVKDIKLFLNTADKNSLKLHYERSTAATIDGTAIQYRGIVETNELGYDLWEVNIKGLTTVTVNYPL